ncbi:unnamed protein product [Euphydryas editha]|uniref:Uncharacterized protein n=1 Tax=Euphydryas editha TaxID=104508 RepID=A0AAU9TXB7_EUPED|nr:unnamed protein product [Euphydryas editha]
MTPQLKIPTHDLHIASLCRSLMNPPTESHSVEIAMPRCDALVHVSRKNKLFVTIKMIVNLKYLSLPLKMQTVFSMQIILGHSHHSCSSFL